MRVLLATDGSEDARAATEWLTRFPLPATTEVLVLAAVAFPPSRLDIPPVRTFTRALIDSAHGSMRDARDVLASHGMAVTGRVVEGDPRQHIAAAAEDWPADLVVMGARGLGPFKGFLLGSVSTAVIHHAPCSVLVVKGRRRAPRTIVLAVDGSVDSLAAARFLAALPLDRGSTVRLVGVVEPYRYPPVAGEALSTYWLKELDEVIEERKTELDGILARVAEDFRGRVATVERSVHFGPASDELIAAAGEPDVDLMVVGARGLGPVARLLLGSVSERVFHHAGCPVLVVKRPRR